MTDDLAVWFDEDGTLDVDRLGEHLRTQDIPLLVLTDEELDAMLEPSHPDGPTGWFAELDDAGREVARTCGTRSLISRGLITPAGGRTVETHPAIDIIRIARHDALGMTLATRQDDGGTVRTMFHCLAPVVIMQETVDGNGFHAYQLRSPSRAAAALAVACNPAPEWRSAGGEPEGGEAPDAELLERLEVLLESAEIRTDIVSLWRRDLEVFAGLDAALTVISLDDMTWGLSIRSDEQGQVSYAAVVELSLDLLAAALRNILFPIIEDIPDEAGR